MIGVGRPEKNKNTNFSPISPAQQVLIYWAVTAKKEENRYTLEINLYSLKKGPDEN